MPSLAIDTCEAIISVLLLVQCFQLKNEKLYFVTFF